MKKITGSIMAGLVLLSGTMVSFVGCGGGGGSSDVDNTKTQIYVGNEANGYGAEWCEQTAAAFEEWAKDIEYEPGKKGVQVQISTRGFTGTTYLNNIKSSQANVIFSEEAYYFDYLSKGVLADVTKAVTEPLTEFGETESIEEKMIADNGTQLVDALTGHDGKYYALPWWSGIQGMTYDVDLFNDKDLFFAKGGAPSEYARVHGDPALEGAFTAYEFTDDSNDLSAGPDGKYGTTDDGLPATYEEFYAMCDQMVQFAGVTPITWTGQYQYGEFITREMFYDYEGYTNGRMSVDFKGTAYDIVESYKTNADGSINFDTITFMGGGDGTPEGGGTGVVINKSNAYLLQQQVGMLYALSFAKKLVDSEGYLSENCFNGNYSHTAMQEAYLKGKYSSKMETSAILVDGTWWLGQASAVFDSMEAAGYEKSGKYERQLAFMPFPKANVSRVGTAGSVRSRRSAMCFVNGNITDENIKKAAMDFFRFCHTDKALKIFNETTGGVRPFDFEYTQEELQELNSFSKSTYEFNNNTEVLYPYAYNELFLNNQTYFSDQAYGVKSNLDSLGIGKEVSRTFETFKNEPTLTVGQYFDGIGKYYSQKNWTDTFGKYFD